MPDLELLERVSLLAKLPEEMLLQVAAEAEGVAVRAGDWLFREGEPAESLFVVRSGRLEVVHEGPPETVVRILRRGEVLGELALLRGDARTASVRAQRDSRLLEVGRERFEAMINQVPSFALGLARAVGERLATSNGATRPPRTPTTVATLPLDGAPAAADAVAQLSDALARHCSVGILTVDPERTEAEMASALDAAERDSDLVLMVGGSDPGDAWTEFCLREAELIVALTGGSPDVRWTQRPAALQGCELVVLETRPDRRVVDTLRPREVEVILDASELEARMASMARRLCGRAVGVVFSGGGARAFAHIGVLEELLAAGVQIDRVAGVSLGAIVAGAAARRLDPPEIYEAFQRGFIEVNPSNDFTVPAYSLLRGRKTRTLLEDAFGGVRIEELPTRFFCLSCDLVSREPVVHRRGSLPGAIYASLAIPGVFPPVPTGDGGLLVDGGVLDNLPVEAMSARAEGPVIAVDVTGHAGGLPAAGAAPTLGRAHRTLRRYLTGTEAEIPRLGETIVRTVTVGSCDTVAAARRHADLVITPEVSGTGMMDWRALPRMRDLGRRAAVAALAAANGSLLD